MRYFIYFSFNGKLYHGWQKQKNSITIQEKIEESLSVLLKDKIEVIGAGRTDAGVHANEMVAHFDVNKNFENSKNFIFKLNQFLSNDISVKSLKSVKKMLMLDLMQFQELMNITYLKKKMFFQMNTVII